MQKGMRVRHVTGGPVMVIKERSGSGQKWKCTWFAKDEYKFALLDEVELVPYEDEKLPEYEHND